MVVDIISVSFLQFATVYKARDKTTDTIVAIKKVTAIESELLLAFLCDGHVKYCHSYFLVD